jgi:hypothetical protein
VPYGQIERPRSTLHPGDHPSPDPQLLRVRHTSIHQRAPNQEPDQATGRKPYSHGRRSRARRDWPDPRFDRASEGLARRAADRRSGSRLNSLPTVEAQSRLQPIRFLEPCSFSSGARETSISFTSRAAGWIAFGSRLFFPSAVSKL